VSSATQPPPLPAAAPDWITQVGEQVEGQNGYFGKAGAFKFDYCQTKFGFNSSAPTTSPSQILRQGEPVFIRRFQVSF
jgi:hypothetical protein